MARNLLTDTEIRKAKPAEKSARLYDGGGLYLELTPKGGRWWRFKYRLGGKEKLLSMGTYPETSLKAARDKRLVVGREIGHGAGSGRDVGRAFNCGISRACIGVAMLARWHHGVVGDDRSAAGRLDAVPAGEGLQSP